jgi:hypothetical protein
MRAKTLAYTSLLKLLTAPACKTTTTVYVHEYRKSHQPLLIKPPCRARDFIALKKDQTLL